MSVGNTTQAIDFNRNDLTLVLGENLDVDISYEEANFIKKTFMDEYQLREMSLIPMKIEDINMTIQGEINFETVDTIVPSQLQQIDSKLMLDIYRNL